MAVVAGPGALIFGRAPNVTVLFTEAVASCARGVAPVSGPDPSCTPPTCGWPTNCAEAVKGMAASAVANTQDANLSILFQLNRLLPIVRLLSLVEHCVDYGCIELPRSLPIDGGGDIFPAGALAGG